MTTLKTAAISAILLILLAAGWFFDARHLRDSLKLERVTSAACADANGESQKTIAYLKNANAALAEKVRVAKDAEQEARAQSEQRAKRDAERLAAKQRELNHAYAKSPDWAGVPVPADVVAGLLDAHPDQAGSN